MELMEKIKHPIIYISLPMGGQEATVRKRYDNAVNELKETYENIPITITGPCNMDNFDDNGIITPRDHDWAWYMGEDAKDLLRSDVIFLTKGWENSTGCRVEKAMADAMAMTVVYAKDALSKEDADFLYKENAEA